MSKTIEISDETFEKLKNQLTEDEQREVNTYSKHSCMNELKRPKNWKGICKKCWDKKHRGYLLKNEFPLSDDYCWSCGKKHDWRESHHKLERFGGKALI